MRLVTGILLVLISGGLLAASESRDVVDPCETDEASVLDAVTRALARPRSADAPELETMRSLVRRARLTNPSLLLDVVAVDLAQAAGDGEESARLLSELARTTGDLLSLWDRLELARAAEARGDRKGAMLQYGHVQAMLQRRSTTVTSWVGERIRRLDAENEASSMQAPRFPAPSAAARQAFAEGKRLLTLRRDAEALDWYRRALRLAPGYVEAALAVASIETRSGKTPEATAAYRTALSADPQNFEATLSLANLLWTEPDRQAKEESLVLLDRAIALRPELIRPRKEAAERWAAWGDAARALERLDAFRRECSEAERIATNPFRDVLARRLAQPGRPGNSPAAPDFSSPAVGLFRTAEVLALRHGDPDSLATALEYLAEAQRLDPSFAPALELEATVRRKRGELAAAEVALRRAIDVDPTRAAFYERLAEILEQQPARRGEAEALWERAERAGSREALFQLARAATDAGSPGKAEALLRRYLEESPDGPQADEARSRLSAALERRRLLERLVLSITLVVTAAALVWLLRRHRGTTLERWLERDPAQAREIRPTIGRLRHEMFKHGGLLLKDAASRLRSGDSTVQLQTATLLHARLFGTGTDPGERGLVPESRRTLDEVAAFAADRGIRLNLRFKDPLFSPVYRALAELTESEKTLERFATDPVSVSKRQADALARRLGRAASVLNGSHGARVGALLDAASSTRVSGADLERLLIQVSKEAGSESPPMQLLGLLGDASHGILVRVDRTDWETIWRNLFANVVASGSETTPGRLPRLALRGDLKRDPITGESLARFVLADDISSPLTSEMIRGRAAERGLGVVADLVRRNEGIVDVVGPPEGAEHLTKGILIEVSALEAEIS